MSKTVPRPLRSGNPCIRTAPSFYAPASSLSCSPRAEMGRMGSALGTLWRSGCRGSLRSWIEPRRGCRSCGIHSVCARTS
jgi:hypothetical protein